MVKNIKDRDILIALLRHPQLSEENLKVLIETEKPKYGFDEQLKYYALIEEVKLHINWPETIENEDDYLYWAIDSKVRESYSSYEFSHLLSGLPSESSYEKLMWFDKCNQAYLKPFIITKLRDVNVLNKLATDSDEKIRRAVGENHNTPVNLLEQLSTDSEGFVRRGVYENSKFKSERENRRKVAENSQTSVDILEKLATDSDKDVRYRVVQNYNTPVNILEKLATDCDHLLRVDLAENPNTPSHILEQLATYSDYSDRDVRRKVAEHPNTSVHTLEKLATDSEDWVRRIVG